jgi:4-amino-4-deoxy-L-arabinose transferase-like glycosyltransferase
VDEVTRPSGSVRARAVFLEIATVAAFCAFLFFYGLGAFGLVGADEPRYAQIAREMLAKHEWVTPVLNGQPWLEKPILYYWQAIIAYKLFGVSDWAARLPSALDASVMVFAVYWFVRRFRRGAQADAALMIASTAIVIGFGRAASMDMPLAAMFTVGILCWAAWRQTQIAPPSDSDIVPRGSGKLFLLGFYFFMGLGMLAKGPVAPGLAAILIVVLAAFRRNWRIVTRTLWVPGIALFLAVVLPWYIAVQRANHEFFRVFFLEHNIERFGTNLYRHQQPVWYYIPVMIIALMPWTAYCIAGFVEYIRNRGVAARWELRLFLLIWAAAPVIFFSISQSKLPGYILPAIPAWTLLMAEYVHDRMARGEPSRLWFALVHGAFCGILLSVALMVPTSLLRTGDLHRAETISSIAGMGMLAGVVISLTAEGLKALRFVTLVTVVLSLGFVLKLAAPALDAKLSARPIAQEISSLGVTRTAVAVYLARREVQYGLNYYLDAPISRYEWGEVPAADHLVIAAPSASKNAAAVQDDLSRMAGGRRVIRVGRFGPQQLVYFWVTSTGQHHH